MPTVASMPFPLELAVATAREAAPATADDMGYVVKTIVGETYGREAIKPWRIAQEGGGKLRIVGWIDDEPGVPVPKSKFASDIEVGFERHPPVERSAFLLVHLLTARTPDLGMCLHDWASGPCRHHGACAAGCANCAVVKGDPVGRERARQRLAEAEIMLDKARAEAGDGTYGAANFVAYHGRLVAALRSIIAIHDDASIPDGTIIQLPALPVSEEPIRRAG